MPYPDEFEGFMINEIGKHTDFKKQTVRTPRDTSRDFVSKTEP